MNILCIHIIYKAGVKKEQYIYTYKYKYTYTYVEVGGALAGSSVGG